MFTSIPVSVIQNLKTLDSGVNTLVETCYAIEPVSRDSGRLLCQLDIEHAYAATEYGEICRLWERGRANHFKPGIQPHHFPQNRMLIF